MSSATLRPSPRPRPAHPALDEGRLSAQGRRLLERALLHPRVKARRAAAFASTLARGQRLESEGYRLLRWPFPSRIAGPDLVATYSVVLPPDRRAKARPHRGAAGDIPHPGSYLVDVRRLPDGTLVAVCDALWCGAFAAFGFCCHCEAALEAEEGGDS